MLRTEILALSSRDLKVFFAVLAHPPKPNERLRRAFREAEKQIERRDR